MGIDARLIVRGTVTDEQLEAAVKFFSDRYLDQIPARNRWSGLVEVDLDGSRYYGPGYERGSWPRIADAIVHTRAAFPDHVVAYGGDSDDDEMLPEATDELLAENWAHWLSPEWNAYHERQANR